MNLPHLFHAADAIAFVGATAAGKTASSLETASLLASEGISCEVISADSRQCYRFLSIGTAKPSQAECASVPHHFIDCLNPDETCSAGEFGSRAASILADIRLRGKFPLIVGGSGLYLQALCDGMFDESAHLPTENNDEYNRLQSQIRSRLQDDLETYGIAPLYDELCRYDPVSAEKYAERNPRRIIRALEHFLITGVPLSQAHQQTHQTRSFSTMFIGVACERERLYKRINTRTEAMFRTGIIEETEAVLQMGYAPTLNALNTVGYKECIAYLRGEISRDRAQELTAQNTRRYAKRQGTWFRRDNRIHWLEAAPQELAREVVRKLRRAEESR
ncbi:MAG: tRNA (adenosine(37)-N6)-dimethylallyltransferase MiaA [Candidatus Kapaibacterium sp.]|nr:MAG: tRNA (adenosine(37)-N6)-dimethylallyltransferase MiaA [Candidatus Kapabacteria bacterium]